MQERHEVERPCLMMDIAYLCDGQGTMTSVMGAVTSKIDKFALGGATVTTPVLGHQGSYSAPGGMGGYSGGGGGGPESSYVAPGRPAMQGFGNPNYQDARSSSSSTSILQKAGEVNILRLPSFLHKPH